MNVALIDLKNLQAVDDQRRSLHDAIAEASARLKTAQDRLKAAEGALKTLALNIEALKKGHLELENEISSLSAKRKTARQRQSLVKNNNEYKALLKEDEYLSGRLNATEDELLGLLDHLEKAEREHGDAEIALAEKNAEFRRIAAEAERLQRDGEERLADLEAQRLALTAALPPFELGRYNSLVHDRGGQAVAPAAGGMCLACRLGFPPQIYNDLQRNEKIIVCPNCGRILFWREHPDFQNPAPE
ncbi:MAG: C4-type zinc ribbon domain-containing protein [Candidatus Adiutrix sp.]|jgi:predicted  nucleic acid-binding Zn-ribbon protein|nr:C4-type zinc ribbon domain-containing protein [Candidatus Adiutrix sp.]